MSRNLTPSFGASSFDTSIANQYSLSMDPRSSDSNADRARRIDYVADHLLLHAGALVRLLVRESASEITRSEAGVLFTLSRGPRRITELAELEGLAQPTMTALVKRLERQGCGKRERPADDRRVVLLSLTDAGEAALEAFRARVGAI